MECTVISLGIIADKYFEVLNCCKKFDSFDPSFQDIKKSQFANPFFLLKLGLELVDGPFI
jgi:hypothetical protein